MKKNPSISIIMPVYNSELYIDHAVQSILQQTFQDWELLLIDDCSTDGSPSRCDEWSLRDERIVTYHLSENKGAGNARNVGIDHSRGTYIGFVDSDDYIAEDLYEDVWNKTGNSDADVIVWGVTEEYYDVDGKKIQENKLSMATSLLKESREIQNVVMDLEDKTLFGYQWNHLYKRELLLSHSIYFEPVILYEDFFFNLKVISQVRVMSICDNTGYFYQKRMNQSITHKYVPEYFLLSKRRVSEMVNLYKRWDGFDQKIMDSCCERYLRYILSALARNCDKQSTLSISGRRKWIRSLFQDDLFGEVCVCGRARSKILRVLKCLIEHKCVWGCLLLGRLMFVIKFQFPGIFRKGSIIQG